MCYVCCQFCRKTILNRSVWFYDRMRTDACVALVSFGHLLCQFIGCFNNVSVKLYGVVGQQGWARELQFSDRQLHISNRGDACAHNFNFAPKFPLNGGFSVPNFVFLDGNFPA